MRDESVSIMMMNLLRYYKWFDIVENCTSTLADRKVFEQNTVHKQNL